MEELGREARILQLSWQEEDFNSTRPWSYDVAIVQQASSAVCRGTLPIISSMNFQQLRSDGFTEKYRPVSSFTFFSRQDAVCLCGYLSWVYGNSKKEGREEIVRESLRRNVSLLRYFTSDTHEMLFCLVCCFTLLPAGRRRWKSLSLLSIADSSIIDNATEFIRRKVTIIPWIRPENRQWAELWTEQQEASFTMAFSGTSVALAMYPISGARKYKTILETHPAGTGAIDFRHALSVITL